MEAVGAQFVLSYAVFLIYQHFFIAALPVFPSNFNDCLLFYPHPCQKIFSPDVKLSTIHSLLAEFPANTNILYVDLHSAEQVGSRNDESSLPGLVLNIKKQIEYVDHYGIKHRYEPIILASNLQICHSKQWGK